MDGVHDSPAITFLSQHRAHVWQTQVHKSWYGSATLFWAVGIFTVIGGLSFSSRVSSRVLLKVPGWRVARASTQTVTPDAHRRHTPSHETF